MDIVPAVPASGCNGAHPDAPALTKPWNVSPRLSYHVSRSCEILYPQALSQDVGNAPPVAGVGVGGTSPGRRCGARVGRASRGGGGLEPPGVCGWCGPLVPPVLCTAVGVGGA